MSGTHFFWHRWTSVIRKPESYCIWYLSYCTAVTFLNCLVHQQVTMKQSEELANWGHLSHFIQHYLFSAATQNLVAIIWNQFWKLQRQLEHLKKPCFPFIFDITTLRKYVDVIMDIYKNIYICQYFDLIVTFCMERVSDLDCWRCVYKFCLILDQLIHGFSRLVPVL